MKTIDENRFCALIVDDEEDSRDNLRHILEKVGIKVTTAADGCQALEKLRSPAAAPSVVLLDVRMPGMNGVEVLKKIRETDASLPVILITAYADIRQAVETMRDGAYDYIAKPFDNQEVAKITLRALSETKLKKPLRKSTEIAQEYLTLFESMGHSEAIARITADVQRVSQTDFSVLIMGETGAGKDLVAEAIHRNSARGRAPFVIVDCGAIPEALLESELFGHEKGSFTGADRQKTGKFEVAHGGSLFLDEIANLPYSSQAKLLRAIQNKVVNRVGGTKPIEVDFRLIAATNMALREMVIAGTFREDLYYRLCDFAIQIPALRDRKEDVLFLAKRFLDVTAVELGKNGLVLSDAAIEALIAYRWPGNVRELRSVIRRAAVLVQGTSAITEKELGLAAEVSFAASVVPPEDGAPWKSASLRDVVTRSVAEVERTVITGVLQYTGGNKAKAARLLQIDYKTMHNKTKKLGIQAQRRER